MCVLLLHTHIHFGQHIMVLYYVVLDRERNNFKKFFFERPLLTATIRNSHRSSLRACVTDGNMGQVVLSSSMFRPERFFEWLHEMLRTGQTHI